MILAVMYTLQGSFSLIVFISAVHIYDLSYIHCQATIYASFVGTISLPASIMLITMACNLQIKNGSPNIEGKEELRIPDGQFVTMKEMFQRNVLKIVKRDI